ncbi:hypothetical protein COOONC_12468 [Cooperia oncophora]
MLLQAPRFAPREAPQEAPRPPPRLTLPRDVPPPTIEEHIVGIRDGPNASAEPFHIKNAAFEDPKNIVNAEMYVSDALEYLGNQEAHSPTGAFVMEEDMLSSHGSQRRPEVKPY